MAKKNLHWSSLLLVGATVAYLVNRSESEADQSFVIGPYGKRDTVTLGERGNNPRVIPIDQYYRDYIENWTPYLPGVYFTATQKDSTEDVRQYLKRAYLNYKWGYTFVSNFSFLEADQKANRYMIVAILPELKWPLPRK